MVIVTSVGFELNITETYLYKNFVKSTRFYKIERKISVNAIFFVNLNFISSSLFQIVIIVGGEKRRKQDEIVFGGKTW